MIAPCIIKANGERGGRKVFAEIWVYTSIKAGKARSKITRLSQAPKKIPLNQNGSLIGMTGCLSSVPARAINTPKVPYQKSIPTLNMRLVSVKNVSIRKHIIPKIKPSVFPRASLLA